MKFTDKLILIAEKRASEEGLQKKTLARQKNAISYFEEILNGNHTRMIRPGRWIGEYSAEGATSTVISNMRFIAAIMEWEGVKNGGCEKLCEKTARAIRQALAVRAE